MALIRLLNGVLALVAPQLLTRRFDAERDAPPVAHYAFRMFGVRTVLIALDLLRASGSKRAHAMHAAPLIHASDLAAAILAARSGLVPKRTGQIIVAISGLNTLLALAMQGGSADDDGLDS
ncbi:MAG: hypothetical protein ABIP13_04500 [Tepidiformaceae bacterium]